MTRPRHHDDPPCRPMVDVVLPVLDEVDAIPWVLARMPAGFRPIVVDNGSTDGSSDVASRGGAVVVERAPARLRRRLLRRPRRGHGSDRLLHGLRRLPRPGRPRGADRTGSETAPPTWCSAPAAPDPGAWPLHARLANRWLAREVRRRTDCRLSDLGPMRAARRADLLGLGLRDRRSGWPLEMVLRAGAAGWRISEVPVRYRARRGRSKVTGTLGGTLRAVHDMPRPAARPVERPIGTSGLNHHRSLGGRSGQRVGGMMSSAAPGPGMARTDRASRVSPHALQVICAVVMHPQLRCSMSSGSLPSP